VANGIETIDPWGTRVRLIVIEDPPALLIINLISFVLHGVSECHRSGFANLSSPRQQWTALDRWARDRAIGTEHATIASEGHKPRPAALAVIEELAGSDGIVSMASPALAAAKRMLSSRV
jgi:hypothetical protein